MTADLQPLQRGIVNTVRQVADVANARVEPFEERLAMKADALTRGAYYAATADVLVAALHRCVDATFERVGTLPAGHDPDGRVIVPLPWSKRQCDVYGLRRSQSDMLRHIVETWQAAHAAGQFKTPPIFVKVATGKWYVSQHYTDSDAAHRAIGKWLSPVYVRKVEIILKQRRDKRAPKR